MNENLDDKFKVDNVEQGSSDSSVIQTGSLVTSRASSAQQQKEVQDISRKTQITIEVT